MNQQATNLVKAFSKANLTLKIEEKPMRTGRGMDSIVQMDIGRSLKGNSRKEWFRLYIPEGGALIQVMNTDPSISHLVLYVKEKERTFEETVTVSKWELKRESFENIIKERKKNLRRSQKILRTNKAKRQVVIQRTTEPQGRHFLMGVDERQLFIAQLRGSATSVREAHKKLGSTVEFFKSKRKGSKMDRQGEWFFLETDQETRRAIDDAIKENRTAVHKKVSIGAHAGRPGGNPHTVDELVNMDGIPLEHGWAVRGRPIFVRGKVRHIDHKTIRFSQWREVVANNEGATASASFSSSGVLWVD